jgi:hypothetical protein
MPATADADKVEAKYSDGILEIRVPKSKEAQSLRRSRSRADSEIQACSAASGRTEKKEKNP